MSDALDKLIALNNAYKWLNGAKKVSDATKVVRDSAKTVNDMARDVRKGGKAASVDWKKLEKLLGANGRELSALNDHWTDQARDVQATADASWPAIPNDARKRFADLMALERAEGADSPAFARALGDTVKQIESYREKVVERASYCAMVAEQADDMEAAYLDANDAIDETFKLLNLAFVAFEPISGAAAATAMKHMINIERTIRNRPKAVARSYRALADAAKAHGSWQKKEQAEIDVALDKLYRMQGEEFLRDAGDFLKGLFKAA